jgi:hypothetical protein
MASKKRNRGSNSESSESSDAQDFSFEMKNDNRVEVCVVWLLRAAE